MFLELIDGFDLAGEEVKETYFEVDEIGKSFDFSEVSCFSNPKLSEDNIFQKIVRRIVVFEGRNSIFPKFCVKCNLEVMPNKQDLECLL